MRLNQNIACFSTLKASDTIDICVRVFSDKVNVRIRDKGAECDPQRGKCHADRTFGKLENLIPTPVAEAGRK